MTPMLCPVCKTDLKISERQGIEIDYCSTCGGIWLDRGELDKLIDRSALEYRSVEHSREYQNDYSHNRQNNHGDEHDHDNTIDPKTGKRKRRGGPLGFLSELFD